MSDLRWLASTAYIWGSALVRSAQLRQNTTRPDDPFVGRSASSAGAPLNNIGHQRKLSDPSYNVGVAPNVDTLYSLAWLDLDGGPMSSRSPNSRRSLLRLSDRVCRHGVRSMPRPTHARRTAPTAAPSRAARLRRADPAGDAFDSQPNPLSHDRGPHPGRAGEPRRPGCGAPVAGRDPAPPARPLGEH